jgi:hypothetical protein
MRVVFCFIFILFVLSTVAALPPYTPATQAENYDVRVTITDYFNQGYNKYEILAFLSLLHGAVMSLRTLKRWLRRLQLKRPSQRNEMTKRLKKKHNLVVRRDTIMRAMRVIDPDGVNARKRRRPKRRQYNTPGPNFLWHIMAFVARMKTLL